MELIMKGKCWKFGDNLSTDGDILPRRMIDRDAQSFKDYLMTGVDPEFPKKVQPGDIIVAGKRFGHGNPHRWGFLAMKEIGVGLIAESVARGSYRNSVTYGVPLLPAVEDITKKVNQGDELEVNFRTGEIKDLTTGKIITTEPLPEPLLEIIEAGGQVAFLKRKLAFE